MAASNCSQEAEAGEPPPGHPGPLRAQYQRGHKAAVAVVSNCVWSEGLKFRVTFSYRVQSKLA